MAAEISGIARSIDAGKDWQHFCQKSERYATKNDDYLRAAISLSEQ
jgi:hypothetical protein